jgi:hypothetical protein
MTLSMVQLRRVFIFLMCGLAVSTLIFIGEQLVNKYSPMTVMLNHLDKFSQVLG